MKKHELCYLLENVTRNCQIDKPNDTDYFSLIVQEVKDNPKVHTLLYIPINKLEIPSKLFDLYVGGDDDYYGASAEVYIKSIYPDIVLLINNKETKYYLNYSDCEFLCSDVWDNGIEAISSFHKKHGRNSTISPITQQDNYLLKYHNYKLENSPIDNNGTIMISDVDSIPHDYFSNREDIKEVVLLNVKTIGQYAFNNCLNLKRIKVLGGLNRICFCAFVGCDLEYIDFDCFVENIEVNVFLKANEDMDKFKVIIRQENPQIEQQCIEKNIQIEKKY